MNAWSARILSVLRIAAALLYMEHGLMKLLHFPVAQPGVPDPLPTLLVVAAILEITLGLLLTLGLFTRIAAFVASGQMAAAYSSAISHRVSGRAQTAAAKRSSIASSSSIWLPLELVRGALTLCAHPLPTRPREMFRAKERPLQGSFRACSPLFLAAYVLQCLYHRAKVCA